ncbi:MAG: DUF3011 domain-containing protein [Marinicellaceae bacterium]
MKKMIILILLISSTAFSQLVVQGINSNNDKFLDKYNYHNDNDTIVCESINNRRAECYVDARFGVNIIRQISRSSCNYNWGYNQNGIWVDNGCRAEFSVNRGWDQSGSDSNIMVCESVRYKRNYCQTYLDGRDVFLLNQLSNSSCVNNWGYDRDGIWVTNGCRAEFVIEDRYMSYNDILTCSSRNLKFQSCRADTRGGVEFIKQISRASCNGNWGYDRNGIWVDNGCRARFRIIPYQNPSHNTQDTVKCSSRSYQRKACFADTSGGVRLLKQHSNASCRGNWGYTRNQVWVDNGCRATFQLNVHGNQNQHNNQGYNGQNQRGRTNNRFDNLPRNQSRHDNIICSSRNSQRKTCSIPNGAKVKLERQISRSSCVGQWGYNRREIWVDNGCRAEFSIH